MIKEDNTGPLVWKMNAFDAIESSENHDICTLCFSCLMKTKKPSTTK